MIQGIHGKQGTFGHSVVSVEAYHGDVGETVIGRRAMF
jgi:hypothetical protein